MKSRNDFIKEKTFDIYEGQNFLEEYAKENMVPIISKESLDFLITLIKIKKPKKIIEFGTAIGYSAISMAMQCNDIEVLSFERNQKRYEVALENIKKFNLQNRIKVYNIDATDSKKIFENKKFDMAFIDAAKGQYKIFFDLVFDNINNEGIIVSDNLFHKDIVLERDIKKVEKRQRTIYRRMNDYIKFLKNENNNFFTSILPIGDGIAVTYKK